MSVVRLAEATWAQTLTEVLSSHPTLLSCFDSEDLPCFRVFPIQDLATLSMCRRQTLERVTLDQRPAIRVAVIVRVRVRVRVRLERVILDQRRAISF